MGDKECDGKGGESDGDGDKEGDGEKEGKGPHSQRVTTSTMMAMA